MLKFLNIFNKKTEPKAEPSRQELANALLSQMASIRNAKPSAQVEFIKGIKKISQSVEREEIQDWQSARQMAIRSTHPLPYALIEIYRRTLLDPHLSAAIRNRKSRVLNKFFELKEKDGTANPDKTDLLNREWFRKYLNFELDTLFWGFGLAWFGDERSKEGNEFMDFSVVPRQNIVPATRSVVEYRGQWSGVSFDSEQMADWHIFSCLPDEWTEEHLGLLNKAAPLKIMKNHSWLNWDEFEERHGIPMVIAKTGMNDETVMAKIFDWLSNLTNGNNVAVLPNVAGEIQLIEASNTDVFNLFNQKIERANTELSKLVEGATSTLDQGQKFQTSDVHERTSGNITADDMRYLKYRVENALIPFLVKHGYPFSGDESFDFVNAETLSKTQKLDYVVNLGAQGYQFDVEQLQDLVGVEITAQPSTLPEPPNRPQAKKTDAPVPTNALGAEWRQNVADLYAHSCNSCVGDALKNEGEADIDPEEFKVIWDRLAQALHAGEQVLIDEELWLLTSSWLQRAVSEGFDLADNAPSEALVGFLNTDVAVFSAFKTYQELREATDLLLDADGKLKSFSAFKADILALTGTYDLNYLKAEYVNAITSAQSAAQWERFEEDADTFDLQYQTAGDERVRKEHERLDNIVRPVDDKVWDSIMPPNGWRCRCDVVQVEGEPLTKADKAQREADRAHRNDIFKFNPGKSRQAFPDKHPYYEVRSADDKQGIDDFIEENI